MEKLVENDLKNQATPQELEMLNGNLETWKAILVEKLGSVDVQLQTNKARFAHLDPTDPEFVSYSRWRTGATCFRNVVVRKLHTVKLLIKERVQPYKSDDAAYREELFDTLDLILDKLEAIEERLNK